MKQKHNMETRADQSGYMNLYCTCGWVCDRNITVVGALDERFAIANCIRDFSEARALHMAHVNALLSRDTH
jgi:hypothetical protein